MWWEKKIYEDVDKLWSTLKEQMKGNSSKIIEIQYLQKLSNDQSSSRNTSKMSQFANDIKNELKDKSNKEQKNKKFEQIISKLLKKRKNNTDNFTVKDGKIKYEAKYENVCDKDTLQQQIKNTPEGVLVDDDLLYFTFQNVKKAISKLEAAKKIKMVKAATYEKQKQVQEKGFENYRLFSMRLENEQPTLNELLKFEGSNKKNKREQQNEGFKIRSLFQRFYTENQTKITNESKEDTSNFDKMGYTGSEDYNKRNIENYNVLKDEWLKRQKK